MDICALNHPETPLIIMPENQSDINHDAHLPGVRYRGFWEARLKFESPSEAVTTTYLSDLLGIATFQRSSKLFLDRMLAHPRHCLVLDSPPLIPVADFPFRIPK